jgi:opacity protein-like surface antigen
MIDVRRFWRRIPGLLGLAVLLAAAPVAAEGFFDLYFGAAFPESGDVDVKADDPFWNAPRSSSPPGAQYTSDVDWDTSPSFGMRGGYWFEQTGVSFIGIGLDFSYYQAREDDNFAPLDVYLTPITPLLMLRVPLGYSERYPGGRIQPYAAVGPGFTIAAAHADLEELSSTGAFLDDFDDATFAVGLDARAGLAVALSPHFALFGEYRYTYVEPEFDDEVDDSGALDFDTDFEIEPEIQTHHIIFGLSFRF